MAGTSDEQMESLIGDFDRIHQGYKDALLEIQSLKSMRNCEARRREALESACDDLKQDNERLKKFSVECLDKFANQVLEKFFVQHSTTSCCGLDSISSKMKCHTKCQTLKNELEKANQNLLKLDIEHKRTMELLNQEYGRKIHDLEKQIGCHILQQEADQSLVNRLQQDLAACNSQIGILNNKLEQISAELESKYHHEIQGLKDWVLVEQEDKYNLQKKLQNAEDELESIRKKQMDQQRNFVSLHHVEALKQKIMKLRKENESLKRQISSSKLDGT